MAAISYIQSGFTKLFVMPENMGIDTKITSLCHLEHILRAQIHLVVKIQDDHHV